MHAKAWTWIAHCWQVGLAPPAPYCVRWLRLSGATCWPPPSCIPMTRRSRCSLPAMAKPRLPGCGHTCAMTGQAATRRRQPFGLPTRPTAGASIGRPTLPSSEAYCKQMAGFKHEPLYLATDMGFPAQTTHSSHKILNRPEFEGGSNI